MVMNRRVDVRLGNVPSPLSHFLLQLQWLVDRCKHRVFVLRWTPLCQLFNSVSGSFRLEGLDVQVYRVVSVWYLFLEQTFEILRLALRHVVGVTQRVWGQHLRQMFNLSCRVICQ